MPDLERLHRKIIAFGKQFAAGGQFKTLAMPVIDAVGPVRAERMSGWRRADRVISDFDAAFAMGCDRRAQLFGEHLCAEANAEKRPLFAQRDFDPVDFPANVIVAVIGAHRAAEDDRAGMPIEGFAAAGRQTAGA